MPPADPCEVCNGTGKRKLYPDFVRTEDRVDPCNHCKGSGKKPPADPDLAALCETLTGLAEKATPGKRMLFRAEDDSETVSWWVQFGPVSKNGDAPDSTLMEENDAAFIQATDPDTVTRLVAEVTRLRADRERLAKERDLMAIAAERLRAELAGRTPGPVNAEAVKAADRVLHSFDEPYYEPDVSLACRELLRLAGPDAGGAP